MMGKNRKGYNWRARQQTTVIVKESSSVPVQNDLYANTSLETLNAGTQDSGSGGPPDTNYIVLPSKKRATEKISVKETKKIFLSKRQQKMRDRLKEKRIKSSKRGDLIKSIQLVQASEEEMNQIISVTEMQTKGLKRHFRDIQRSKKPIKKRKETELTDPLPEATGDLQMHEAGLPENESDSEASSSVTQNLSQKSAVMLPFKSDSIPADIESDSDVEKQLPVSEPDIPNPFRRLHTVSVQRLSKIIEGRELLPVIGEEQVIMEAVHDRDVVVISGETGSGKTTQVPQFLYEAGYASGNGIIGVTEPRRVAAISMAKRVGLELNRPSEVSYKIRYEGTVNEQTKIKFMTDGVLMREVATDFLLKKYSVIILDEAHERSVYTDVLIGLLSRIVPLRRKRGLPLKLIIMSATLRVQDFTENRLLFPVPPPVVKIDARQFPVTIHYNRRTPKGNEYLEEALKKICKIHRELPSGGILVFVTSQQEVHALCKQLRDMFPIRKESRIQENEKITAQMTEAPKLNLRNFKLDSYPIQAIDEEDGLAENMDDLDEYGATSSVLPENPMFILPLYSLLPSDRQALVFEPPPEGSRLCVIATNVAETSLTIPNIKYVVDTGKTKAKLYDKNTGLSTFRVMWTSQASANQRAGRSGRTSEGHCYRLYSSSVLQHEFEPFTPAEITLRPIEDLILQMKAMNIEKTVNFPFPSPPNKEALLAAEKELLELGAIEPDRKNRKDAEKVNRITQLGRTMSVFPVAPRFAKMLALSGKHGLMPYMITVVASLTVQEPIIERQTEDECEMSDEFVERQRFLKQLKQRWIGTGFSKMLGDIMVLLKAVGAAEFAGTTKEYCDQHYLRYKAMREIRQLRQQLCNAINLAVPDLNVCVDPKLPPPSQLQCKMILQILLSCMGAKIARKVSEQMISAAEPTEKTKLRHAYQTSMLDQLVYIHPSSVLFSEEPEFILYQEIFEGNKIYCRNIVEIESSWIPKYVPQRCIFELPSDTVEPHYDARTQSVMCKRTSTFGPHAWPMPPVEADYPSGVDLYRWFGRFFLEGLVCPKLFQLTQHLLVKPSVMIKSWADLQPRTQSLLQALVERDITSRRTLETVWQKNPNYLLREYLQWLPEAYRTFATGLWPPR